MSSLRRAIRYGFTDLEVSHSLNNWYLGFKSNHKVPGKWVSASYRWLLSSSHSKIFSDVEISLEVREKHTGKTFKYQQHCDLNKETCLSEAAERTVKS